MAKRGKIAPFSAQVIGSSILIAYVVLINFLVHGPHYALVYHMICLLGAAFFFASIPETDYHLVIRRICLVFCLYLIVSLIYWFFWLDGLSGSTQGLSYSRMGSSLFRVVYLGAIIPAVFIAFFLIEGGVGKSGHEKSQIWVVIFFLTISTLGVIATGSRTGLFLLLPFIWFAFTSIRSWQIRLASRFVFLIAIILAAVILIPTLQQTRFSSLSGVGRIESLAAGLNYFSNGSAMQILFGSGFGQIYPYWTWLSEGAISWDDLNFFTLGGKSSLVSPHNSMIWILVEGGALLFLAYFLFFMQFFIIAL